VSLSFVPSYSKVLKIACAELSWLPDFISYAPRSFPPAVVCWMVPLVQMRAMRIAVAIPDA
jgi:hypothetical protein